MSITSDLNSTPTASTGSNLPPSLMQRAGSFVANVGKDALNTLVVNPAVRLGQAVGSKVAPLLGATPEGVQNAVQQDTNVPILGGMNVPAQKPFGQGGAEQIGGQALKTASYLYGGEGLAELPKTAGIGAKIAQGAKIGSISGGLGAGGQTMSQGGGASEVAKNAAFGAVVGAPIGGVTGGLTGLVTDHPVFKANGYQASVDAATAANKTVAEQGVNAVNEMGGTINDFKGDLGNQFSQAPKVIEQNQPGVGLDLPTNTLEDLNKLKDTKKFVLPDYLRPSSANFGNDNIDIAKLGSDQNSGIRLTPSQTQDLITQLDGLTYKAKASGDLEVNQQTINLVKQLKDQAQNSFGHVVDEGGNSVWSRAYQDYRQGVDAVDAMSDIVNVNRTPGEMSSPLDVQKSYEKILDLQKTPQGQVILGQAVDHFKKVSGYDLSNPMETVGKILKSNEQLKKVMEGTFGHKFLTGATSPQYLGKRMIEGVAISIIWMGLMRKLAKTLGV